MTKVTPREFGNSTRPRGDYPSFEKRCGDDRVTRQVGDTNSLSRRRLLGGLAATGVVSAAGGAVLANGVPGADEEHSDPAAPEADDAATVAFHGPVQAGIWTPPQRHVIFSSFNIVSPDIKDLTALLKEWTLACEALTAGREVHGRQGRRTELRPDSGLALGLEPAQLTITWGFGPSLFDSRFGLADRRPIGLTPLPAFPGDQLSASSSDGDVVVQLCADDRQILTHAFLELRAVAVGRATLRWSQHGFSSPSSDGAPQRSLIGHHDGTANPSPNSDLAQQLVLSTSTSEQAWMRGGTYGVFRKIRLRLGPWHSTPAAEQDRVVGRRLVEGSPLSAPADAPLHTPVDLTARDSAGSPPIHARAHVRGMHRFPMYRRGYNYDDGFNASDNSQQAHPPADPAIDHDHGPAGRGAAHNAYDAGLLFVTFNADPGRQFVPAQRHIAASDDLATFMLTVASALYAVPPGVQPGQHLGHELLAGIA